MQLCSATAVRLLLLRLRQKILAKRKKKKKHAADLAEQLNDLTNSSKDLTLREVLELELVKLITVNY